MFFAGMPPKYARFLVVSPQNESSQTQKALPTVERLVKYLRGVADEGAYVIMVLCVTVLGCVKSTRQPTPWDPPVNRLSQTVNVLSRVRSAGMVATSHRRLRRR